MESREQDPREHEREAESREASAEAGEAVRHRQAEVPGDEGDAGMGATPPEEDEDRFGVMRPPEGSGPA
jgi:hypothetical protein